MQDIIYSPASAMNTFEHKIACDFVRHRQKKANALELRVFVKLLDLY